MDRRRIGIVYIVSALLAALVAGGCQPAATADRAAVPAYRSEVQVTAVAGSPQYLVSARFFQGEGAAATCISSPRMLVTEGHPGVVTIGSQDPDGFFSGFSMDVVVTRQGAAGAVAAIETQVKDKGKVTWSEKKTVPVGPPAPANP
jgi:hypothetical protein